MNLRTFSTYAERMQRQKRAKEFEIAKLYRIEDSILVEALNRRNESEFLAVRKIRVKNFMDELAEIKDKIKAKDEEIQRLKTQLEKTPPAQSKR